MQMAQLPMTYFGRLPFMRRNKFLGNIIFWVGLMSGFPLLQVSFVFFLCFLPWQCGWCCVNSYVVAFASCLYTQSDCLFGILIDDCIA